MIYLIIMFLIAATGLTSLWINQRRARAHLETVDGFRSSLQRLSEAPLAGPRRRVPGRRSSQARDRGRVEPAARRGAAARGRPSGRRAPMDPVRRAAARKRIDARRHAAARSRAL